MLTNLQPLSPPPAALHTVLKQLLDVCTLVMKVVKGLDNF